jgi:phage replication-related protein YjqB (UPF0714/DUF867 family)
VLDELLAQPGVRERSALRSRVGFMALHGGLEAMTAEIATECAERSGASLYTVVQPDELRWHVPSSRYDPLHSPALAEFLDHVDVVVSIHGFGGIGDPPQRWVTIAVGGGERTLARDIGTRLAAATTRSATNSPRSPWRTGACTPTIPSTPPGAVECSSSSRRGFAG